MPMASLASKLPPIAPARPGWALSLLILFVMILILAASLAMFYLLVNRWTSRRQWVSLAEWARQEGFSRPRGDLAVPEPMNVLSADAALIRFIYVDRATVLLQMALPELVATPGLPVDVMAKNASRPTNVLIRSLVTAWRPVGLRPTAAAESLLDRFSLSSFPLLGNQERFVVYAADAVDARAISDSGARTLLPPDIGLLLSGKHLVLDFSSRPFDTIELNRMRALAEQLHHHLPVSPAKG